MMGEDLYEKVSEPDGGGVEETPALLDLDPTKYTWNSAVGKRVREKRGGYDRCDFLSPETNLSGLCIRGGKGRGGVS